MSIKKFPRPVILLGFVSLFTDIASEMLYPITPIFLTAVLGSSMAVVGIIEGIAEATSSLINDIERSGEINKMLKLAVIDRRGEIVYYSLRPATL